MKNEPLQWYPGHMKKADRQIREKLGLIDTVIEVIDARTCYASRNPDITDYLNNKKHLIVLNKADLADPAETEKWIRVLKEEPGVDEVIAFNALDQGSRKDLIEALNRVKGEKKRHKCLIVGIPNVGKSAIINSLVGQKKTKTGNKPGVTKAQQWLKTNDLWLLDTPGILWPKFDDQQAAQHLIWVGSISDKRFEVENVAGDILKFLVESYPQELKEFYNIDFDDEPVWMIFEKIADSRNLLVKGGEYDYRRTSEMILNDFQNARLGRMSIERAQRYFQDDN